MERKMKFLLFFGAVVVALTACATSSTHQLIHSAKDPEWSGEPFQRILIVGLQERQYRIPFEDTFAAELRSRGASRTSNSRCRVRM